VIAGVDHFALLVFALHWEGARLHVLPVKPEVHMVHEMEPGPDEFLVLVFVSEVDRRGEDTLEAFNESLVVASRAA